MLEPSVPWLHIDKNHASDIESFVNPQKGHRIDDRSMLTMWCVVIKYCMYCMYL